jgi:hypothetical protein
LEKDRRTGLERAEFKPVVLELPDVEIPKGEALKRMGYPSASVELQEPVRSMFMEALSEARVLMRPKAAYRALRIELNDGTRVRFPEEGFFIDSRQVAKLLNASAVAVCFAATVGVELDEAISDRMRNGDMLMATMLDAIGSETADAAADELHWKVLKQQADAAGRSATARFSPGYGDWSLTVQKDLIRVCGGALIGITVTPSSLMIPRKSVSAVLGLNAVQPRPAVIPG